MSDCIHRTVLCLGCGGTMQRCDCEDGISGPRMYDWCGKEERCVRPAGVATGPLAEPPHSEKPTRETVPMPPLEKLVSILLEVADPDAVADWLEASAKVVRATGRIKLSLGSG